MLCASLTRVTTARQFSQLVDHIKATSFSVPLAKRWTTPGSKTKFFSQSSAVLVTNGDGVGELNSWLATSSELGKVPTLVPFSADVDNRMATKASMKFFILHQTQLSIFEFYSYTNSFRFDLSILRSDNEDNYQHFEGAVIGALVAMAANWLAIVAANYMYYEIEDAIPNDLLNDVCHTYCWWC